MPEQNIFPQVVESFPIEKKASYEKKCIFHERLLYQYLLRKIEGWSVKRFIEEGKLEKFALYAVTDFTYLFIKDLETNGAISGLKLISDRNAKYFCSKLKPYPVVFPDELLIQYKQRKIEKVIVMSVLHENEIIDDLLKKGILLNDIIPFVSVLYS